MISRIFARLRYALDLGESDPLSWLAALLTMLGFSCIGLGLATIFACIFFGIVGRPFWPLPMIAMFFLIGAWISLLFAASIDESRYGGIQ